MSDSSNQSSGSDEQSQDERWDFYPCHIDDEPASILIDMGIAEHVPVVGLSSIYWVTVTMAGADEHGMGTPDEAEYLSDAEDRLVALVHTAGLRQVGRIRSAGTWEVVFYGPPDRLDMVGAASSRGLELQGRELDVRANADPEWRYYRELLFPDAERQLWMRDRSVVDVLRDKGDDLTRPRQVDHVAFFPEFDDRQRFADAVRALDFVVVEGGEDPEDCEYRLEFHHVHSVELEEIHGMVVELVELAEKHGGSYDGWGTTVVESSSGPDADA